MAWGSHHWSFSWGLDCLPKAPENMQPELAGSEPCRMQGLEQRLPDSPRNHPFILQHGKLRPREGRAFLWEERGRL